MHHERPEGEWSLIRLPDKKRGWVKTESIGKINSLEAIPLNGFREPSNDCHVS